MGVCLINSYVYLFLFVHKCTVLVRGVKFMTERSSFLVDEKWSVVF